MCKRLRVNLEINMFWDGLFHVFTWIMTAFGIAMLWKAVRRTDVPLTTPTFVGSLSLGCGLFNLVEGIIDHHILHVHHVTETSHHLMWDLTFLGTGIVLILLGAWMIHSDRAVPSRALTI